MTNFPGALDDPDSNRKKNFFQLEMSSMFISGLGIHTFIAKVELIDYMSIMGNLILPYPKTPRKANTLFLYSILSNQKWN